LARASPAAYEQAYATSVVIDNLNLVGISCSPAKTDPPLIIDANTVLAGAIASELLKAIARRNSEVLQRLGRIYCHQLAQHRALQFGGIATDGSTLEERFSVPIGEASDH
jgi:hypothetical protein